MGLYNVLKNEVALMVLWLTVMLLALHCILPNANLEQYVEPIRVDDIGVGNKNRWEERRIEYQRKLNKNKELR